MEPTEIYNLPDPTVSGQWGARQEIYDQQYVAGMVGPSEAAAARAAKTPGMRPQPQQMDLLMGTVQRTTFAQIEPMPGWSEIRWRDTIEAPSLGSIEKRKADIKILETLKTEDPSAELVMRAVQQTIADIQEIQFTRGQMASVLGA